VQLDKGAHDGKSKADAAVTGPGRVGFEAVENMFKDLLRNYAPLIGHGKQDFTISTRRRKIDGMTWR
jgi:hypothetical protein